MVPFATKAHVQPTSEGLRGILFSRSVCHQVLHSLQSDLQSGIRSRIFPVVGFEGFPAACKAFSVFEQKRVQQWDIARNNTEGAMGRRNCGVEEESESIESLHSSSLWETEL